MQVFKLCLMIIYKNKATLLIYIVIFMVVSSFMSSVSAKEMEDSTSFKPVKTEVAFFSDEDTPLINGFREELADVANFVDIPDETVALQDALYYREVSCIIRVPEGFTKKFMNGKNVQLEKISIPNSTKNVHIDLFIDKYFNTARLYVQNMEGITQQELVRYLKKDLSETVSTEMVEDEKKTSDMASAKYSLNFFAYPLLSVIIMGMGTLMLIFNDRDLKMRNNCSPVSSTSISMQFVLGNLVFTFLSWLIMLIICLAMNFRNIFSPNTVFHIAGSFVFAFCCSGISFFIGNLTNSHEAVTAAANVASLGLSFISGVFVPQELIGSSVLKAASFTPTYWYVRANNTIADLTVFSYEALKPVLNDFLIIIGFGLAFFSASLAIRKAKTND